MPVDTPKTARYVEVERKFDVAESTVIPSFEGIAAVARVEKVPTQALDAVYFDTATQDLARNKITLRRRTGGHDSGWCLKLPAGPDARTEIQAPLDALDKTTEAVVPNELLDVVLAIVRDRPVEPIAHITTQRESQVLYSVEGIALAEFCNDHVTAWSARTSDAFDSGDESPAEQQWHEWELELISGYGTSDRELLNRLSNRLLDAGAAPARHGSKLTRVLGTATSVNGTQPPTHQVHRAMAEQVTELLLWDRAVRADAHDAVHQMRVTTRKIRSLLSDSQDVFGLSDSAWIIDELRELAGVLGVARDAEVLGERYQRELDALAPELVRGPVQKRLVDGAQHRYQTGLRRSLAAMRSKRYFLLLDALDKVVTERSGTTFGQKSKPAPIDMAYKRVRKAAKAAAQQVQENQDEQGRERLDDALHRIRKHAKRLRYIATATGTDQVSQCAKAIQTLLGEHQDSVVSREHLIQQADAAHAAGEDTFTYGLLFQQEADLADSRRDQLGAALRKLDKSVRTALR